MNYVTVSIDDFDDETIRQAYESRGLSQNSDYYTTDDVEADEDILTRIFLADREGRKEEAYELMREYVLDKLNRVL